MALTNREAAQAFRRRAANLAGDITVPSSTERIGAMNEATQHDEIERLERAFWESIRDAEPAVATGMLTEPALMVSAHGVNKFDHAGYTKMANDDRFKLVDYDISDLDVMFPRDDVAFVTYRVQPNMESEGKPHRMDVFGTSTWVRAAGDWRCAMHTESAADSKPG